MTDIKDFDELMGWLMTRLPNVVLSEDVDGQIIAHTGMQLDPDVRSFDVITGAGTARIIQIQDT